MRHLYLVGKISPARSIVQPIRPARYCAWGDDGGHWMGSLERALHEAGAPTTHGLCPKHAAEFERELDAMPPKPAA